MNNTQAVYSGIIEKIDALISTDAIEMIEEANSGDESRITLLYDLEEQIKAILVHLNDFKQVGILYPDFEELFNLINENKALLAEQSYSSIPTLLFSLKLVRMLEGSFEEIPSDNLIPFLEFSKFDDIPHYIDSDFYLHVGDNNYDNTILFINTEDGIDQLIENEFIFPDSIVILLLHYLYTHSFEEKQKLLIVKSTEPGLTINRAIAVLKLHLVCSGKSYHKVITSERDNLSSFKNKIIFNKNYNQFDDSFMILSEYNSRKELLNKYLSIYHLVENFMCRYPLVKLQNQNDGNMFSIRNFRGMYDDLDGKEINMIRNFFKVIFSPSYRENHFLSLSHDKFRKLVSDSLMTEPDVDKALKKLGMVSKGTALTYNTINLYSDKQAKAELPQKLADMVYGIRNSIVHNKETEFHLSHEYMEPCIYNFINSYVLNILEEVLLSLLTEENNVIWYTHSQIKLFEV